MNTAIERLRASKQEAELQDERRANRPVANGRRRRRSTPSYVAFQKSLTVDSTLPT
jgi:hypothetical protein